MSKKKRVILGLSGIALVVLCSVLIAVIGNLPDTRLLLLVLSTVVVVGIIVAIMIWGAKSGLVYCGYIIYLITMLVLLELDGTLFWVGLAGVLLIFIGPRLINKWLEKRAQSDPHSKELAQLEADRVEKAIFDGAVYLIRNSKWNPGPVYKVTIRGDMLYFCYADGKFYLIDLDIAEKVNLTEEELLSHKKSFSLPISDIISVDINTKRSARTGSVHNNGTAYIHTDMQKHDFIIHAINDRVMIEEFLKNIAPVTVKIDKHTQLRNLEEQEMQEHTEKSPEKLKSLKRLCMVLNVFSWVYGIWALIFTYPKVPLMVVGLLLPVFAFLLYTGNKDIITLSAVSENKRLRPPNIASALVLPSVGLMMLAFDYNVFHTAQLWATVIIITAMLTVLALALSGEHKRKKWLRVLVPITTAVFAYGAVVTTNIELDPTPHPHPDRHQFTQLERMWVSEGEYGDSFNFSLNVIDHADNMPVQITPDSFNVRTGSINFERAQEDDIIRLCVMPGLWGIPWVQCVTVMISLRGDTNN